MQFLDMDGCGLLKNWVFYCFFKFLSYSKSTLADRTSDLVTHKSVPIHFFRLLAWMKVFPLMSRGHNNLSCRCKLIYGLGLKRGKSYPLNSKRLNRVRRLFVKSIFYKNVNSTWNRGWSKKNLQSYIFMPNATEIALGVICIYTLHCTDKQGGS